MQESRQRCPPFSAYIPANFPMRRLSPSPLHLRNHRAPPEGLSSQRQQWWSPATLLVTPHQEINGARCEPVFSGISNKLSSLWRGKRMTRRLLLRRVVISRCGNAPAAI
ncbi:hypothetical protein Nepgr_028282 [Nepenthes gracilis]|uniref:Uncharacterized protein n=1 Tax=Nepenthes gracilis TaxID=150966 RepID=A0AAD3TBY1_NEPGR|nr:hypothetical protein Nepgr_028282 [Nepenthes gracilis]